MDNEDFNKDERITGLIKIPSSSQLIKINLFVPGTRNSLRARCAKLDTNMTVVYIKYKSWLKINKNNDFGKNGLFIEGYDFQNLFVFHFIDF